MITFVPKTDVPPALEETEENRFERIRKAAAERRRKSDTDGTRRRARQTAEDNRLIGEFREGVAMISSCDPVLRMMLRAAILLGLWQSCRGLRLLKVSQVQFLPTRTRKITARAGNATKGIGKLTAHVQQLSCRTTPMRPTKRMGADGNAILAVAWLMKHVFP